MSSTKEHIQLADVSVSPLVSKDIALLTPILYQHVRDPVTGNVLRVEAGNYLLYMDGLGDEYNRKRHYVVARSPIGVLGCMALTTPEEDLLRHLQMEKDKAGELVNAFVRSDTQGMGVGRKLFDAIAAMAREQGKFFLVLHSGPQYEKSWPFFDKVATRSAGLLPNKYGEGNHSKVWVKEL